jgi:hypothetical protein
VVGFRVILPFAEHWSLSKLGYRHTYQDYDKNNFLWKIVAHGAYVGSRIGF